MLNHWISTTAGLARTAFETQDTLGASWAVALIGLAVLLLVIKAFTSPLDSENLGWARRLLAVGLMLLITIGATAAIHVFVEPHLHTAWARRAVLLALPAAAALFAGIPLMAWLLRARYSVTLLSTAVGTLAALLAMASTSTMVESLHGGNRDFAHVRHRTHAMHRFIATP